MNILLFTDTFFPVTGGAEFVIHHIANQLVNRGHGVTVLAPQMRDSSHGADAIQNVRYRIVRYRRPFSKRIGVEQLLWPLGRLHRESRFDILHCHNAYPPGYIGALFQKWVSDIPVVVTCHGADILMSERLRKSPMLDRRVQWSVQSVDCVTAISRRMYEEIAKAGVPLSRIRLLPNGVDVDDFRRDVRYHHPRPYILSMGSFRHRKGFDVLLQAMRLVAARTDNLDLLMAGDGKRKVKLQEMRDALGLQDRVHFPGIVQGDQKVGLLRSCEFFICPSRWEEPFGLVNVEAMAAGRVSVASRVGGMMDIIRHNDSGVLVSKEDSQGLAAAILKVYEDREWRRRMEENASRDVEAYRWEKIVTQYEELYQDLKRNNGK